MSSIAMSWSTQFEPSHAAAAKPATTPQRPDQSQAAMVRSASGGSAFSGTYTPGSTARNLVRNWCRFSTPLRKASAPMNGPLPKPTPGGFHQLRNQALHPC